MRDIYEHMGKPLRETVVANTSRQSNQRLETPSNKQPQPREVIARAPPQAGNSHPDADPRPARPVGKLRALAEPYGRHKEPEEGLGAGEVRPGGVKVR